MKSWTYVLVAVGFVAAAAQHSAIAQERIYRCGNEYTNNPEQAKQRSCQVVNSGHVTVVHSHAKAQGGTATSANSTAPRAQAVRVDAAQQKSRDQGAKAILQAELAKAQDKLQALQQQFQTSFSGAAAAQSTGADESQSQGQSMHALKAQIIRQEADIAGLERELARHSDG